MIVNEGSVSFNNDLFEIFHGLMAIVLEMCYAFSHLVSK